MNRTAHVNAGVACGAVTSIALACDDDRADVFLEMLGGAIGGWLGGRLPDLLEPATNPDHRAIFHSLTVGGGGNALAFSKLPQLQADLRERARQCTAAGDDWGALGLNILAGLIAGLAAGYVSHLVLDSTTPKSLPIL